MSTVGSAAAPVTGAHATAVPPHPPAHRDPSLPPYRQAAALRQQILSGHLKPGERLPSVLSLQQQYAIGGRRVSLCGARRPGCRFSPG